LPSLHALRDSHPVGIAAAKEGRNEVDQLSMVNVAHQVELIRKHAAVRDALTAEQVQVAGLFLDIRTARLLLLDPEANQFVPMPDDQLLALHIGPVGCQKSATAAEQGLHAARSYSLIKPPRTGRRLIRS
jgi:hypothetical protein